MDPRRYQPEQQQSQHSSSQQNSGQSTSRHPFSSGRPEAAERGSARETSRQFYPGYYDSIPGYPNIFPSYGEDGRPYPPGTGSVYQPVPTADNHVPPGGVYGRGPPHMATPETLQGSHYFSINSGYHPSFGHPMQVSQGIGPVGQHPDLQVDQDQSGAPAPMSAVETQMRLSEFNSTVVQGIRALKSQNFIEFRTAICKLCSWFKTQVEPLELHLDSMELRNERLEIWRNFNHLFLGGLQLHWEIGKGDVAMERGSKLLTVKDIMEMGTELTSVCNALEAHGLVDYEYGIWEEQIVPLLLRNMRALCL